MAQGLLASVRAIPHVLRNRDAETSDVYRRVIRDWWDLRPVSLDRFHEFIVPARNSIIKDLVAPLLIRVDTSNFAPRAYHMTVHLSATPEREALLSRQERKRLSVARKCICPDAEIGIDLLAECERALGALSAELDLIEAEIAAAMTPAS